MDRDVNNTPLTEGARVKENKFIIRDHHVRFNRKIGRYRFNIGSLRNENALPHVMSRQRFLSDAMQRNAAQPTELHLYDFDKLSRRLGKLFHISV